MKTIFLDMDDVVVDFSKAIKNILGAEEKKSKFLEDEWKIILQHQRIYRNLEKCLGADILINFCRSLRDNRAYNLMFLTAVPRKNDMPWAFYDKVLWAQKYYPDIPVWFGPFSVDKWKHCSKYDILIDDRLSNIESWREAGGIAILHENIDLTIHILSQTDKFLSN